MLKAPRRFPSLVSVQKHRWPARAIAGRQSHRCRCAFDQPPLLQSIARHHRHASLTPGGAEEQHLTLHRHWALPRRPRRWHRNLPQRCLPHQWLWALRRRPRRPHRLLPFSEWRRPRRQDANVVSRQHHHASGVLTTSRRASCSSARSRGMPSGSPRGRRR